MLSRLRPSHSFSNLRNFAQQCATMSSSSSSAQPSLPPFDHKPKKYEGPSFDEVHRLRQAHLSPGIFAYYKKPIMIVEGKMQYLFDQTGRRYLDMFAGIVTVSVGHSHPEIVEAASKQLSTVMHTTNIYYNPEIVCFAQELTSRLPGDLKVCYFVNSGSEANDLALMLARLHTGANDIIALRNCYHGMSPVTMGLTALHTWKYPVSQGESVHHALNPNSYRGVFGNAPDAVQKYADDVEDLIRHSTPGKIAGFIAETIQGVGGTVELPDGYLPRVYSHVRAAGGVCIADEVQTGFGRCGTHYWGFETKGVIPDIVTMAKGIGNGFPLAAVVTTPAIAAHLKQRLHFNTYGGNPVASAVGRAVLRVVEKEQLQKKSLENGAYFKDKLLALQKKYDIIGDVRGKGLMIGVELVKDRNTKEPLAKEAMAELFEKTKDLGLLIGKGGLFGNVLRIKPPMCINRADIDFAIDVIDRSLAIV